MSARYLVKPKADRDLDDYAEYLADEANLDVALHFFDAAYRTFALIATQPNMGWRSRIKYPGLSIAPRLPSDRFRAHAYSLSAIARRRAHPASGPRIEEPSGTVTPRRDRMKPRSIAFSSIGHGGVGMAGAGGIAIPAGSPTLLREVVERNINGSPALGQAFPGTVPDLSCAVAPTVIF